MRLLETDSLSNQDISSALEIGSYTADAARKLIVVVLADQVAGNDDYVVYATRQLAGAGSAYKSPVTTESVASGVTAIMFPSIALPVSNTDVVKVYLTGAAGDTTTPDTKVEFWEDDTLRPTTADRTLDISSGGEAGLDWANVGSPTTTVGLTGTTVGLVANAITAAKIATDAITSDELATSAVSEIVTAVLTTAMTEAYAADGAAPTLAQALYEIMQFHNERNVGETTITIKKRDGSTTAYTLTYDSDSITRAT